jgi:hypothetical protein
MSIRILTLAAILLFAHAGTASAQGVKLEFNDGRVNLSAQNAPIRAILAEWTRLGGTTIVNAERVTGTPVTLELQGVPERQALDIILRGVPGYMFAARQTPGPGASRFDRVMILPTTTAPRAATNTATFATPTPRPPAFAEPDVDEDDADEDIGTLQRQDQEALRRAEDLARQRAIEAAQGVRAGQALGAAPGNAGPRTVTTPYQVPAQVAPFPGPPPPVPQAQPGAQVRPSNPFTSLPGSSRPGEVTPVPQENRPQAPPNQEQ